jgi:hypothetical protein
MPMWWQCLARPEANDAHAGLVPIQHWSGQHGLIWRPEHVVEVAHLHQHSLMARNSSRKYG